MAFSPKLQLTPSLPAFEAFLVGNMCVLVHCSTYVANAIFSTACIMHVAHYMCIVPV